MRRATLIGLGVPIFLTGAAWADCWWAPSPGCARTEPESPTPSDVISLTLGGEWPDACTPNDSRVAVQGSDIYFDIIWDYPWGVVCLPMISGWSRTETLGPLAAGAYTVYARIVGHPLCGGGYEPVGEITVTGYQFVVTEDALVVEEGKTAPFGVALLNPRGTVDVHVSVVSGDSAEGMHSPTCRTPSSLRRSTAMFVRSALRKESTCPMAPVGIAGGASGSPTESP